MFLFVRSTTKSFFSVTKRRSYIDIVAMVKTKTKSASTIVSPIKNIQIDDPSWFKFDATTEELTLDNTLPSGQVFRWKKLTDSNNQVVWRGVIRDRVFTFVQLSDQIKYNVVPGLPEKDSLELLNDYFQMKHKLVDLYKTWSASKNIKEEVKKSEKKIKSAADINEEFAWAGSRIKGLRLIRQDPHECLFSFICSQNNNVSRISQMVEKLCAKYGSFISTIDDVSYYKFPELSQLLKATEDELKELGFGYRARYIVASAKQVKENGDDWLIKLREKSRDEVCQELTTLTGVGKKVADCTALFSLDKLDLVPVDTHVWQIAQRFIPKLGKKTLNPTVYTEVGDFFRDRFGPLAGWAHSILFAAELTAFKKTIENNNNNDADAKNSNNTNMVIEGSLNEVAESDELNKVRKNLKRKFDKVE